MSLEKSADAAGKTLPGCAVVRSLTMGNLGITFYYLGQFDKARKFYEMVSAARPNANPNFLQRLESAKSVGDRSGQLRTYSNLGNTCVQLGDYEAAVFYYT